MRDYLAKVDQSQLDRALEAMVRNMDFAFGAAGNHGRFIDRLRQIPWLPWRMRLAARSQGRRWGRTQMEGMSCMQQRETGKGGKGEGRSRRERHLGLTPDLWLDIRHNRVVPRRQRR